MDFKSISEIEFTNSSHPSQIKKVIFHGYEMASSVTQVAYAELRTGDSVEEHSHESMEEVFLILDGECKFFLYEFFWSAEIAEESIVQYVYFC